MAFKFQVEACASQVVSAVNLDPSDKLVLWRMACDGNCPGDGTEVYIPFRPTNCEFMIDVDHNPLLVDFPGAYELRFEGPTNDDVRICIDRVEPCRKW